MIAVPMRVAAAAEDVPMKVAVSFASVDEYGGPFEFTPTDSEQVAHTQDRVLYRDIMIHPIPQNWGRIVYDGITITVL